MKAKVRFWVFASLLLASSIAAAELTPVPPADWSAEERAYVQSARQKMQARGGVLTDEQAGLAVQKMRQVRAKMLGTAMALQSTDRVALEPPPGVTAPANLNEDRADISEADLAAKISQLPKPSGVLELQSRKDGFSVAGRTFVDPEGKFLGHSFDPATGLVGYAVDRGRDFVFKIVSATDLTIEPLVIATATEEPSGMRIRTVTGKNVSSLDVFASPVGFVATREESAFVYEAGKGLQTITAPDGYVLAPKQRGNVATTRHILLKRRSAKVGGASTMSDSFRSLGNVLGMTRKADFALMNIDTQRLHELNVDFAESDVAVHSGCVRQNALLNRCSMRQTYESLYADDGINYGHYFWKVGWYVAADGSPFAVSQEDSSKRIFVIDLRTGRRVLAYERTLGIADYAFLQQPDGKVTIDIGAAFRNRRITDAQALLTSAAAPVNAAPQTKE
jgi:hypothetical protein